MGGIKIESAAEMASRPPLTYQPLFWIGLAAVLGTGIGLACMLLPIKYVLLFLVGAVVLALIYKWPMLGFYLFVIFNITLPQAGPSLNLGIQVAALGGETRGIHLNVHEIIMTMILFTWAMKLLPLPKWLWLVVPLWPFLLIWAVIKSATQEKSPLIPPIFIYVGVFILSCFVGLIHNGSFQIMTFRFIRTVIFVYIFFVVLSSIRTRRQFQQLLIIMLICSTVVAIFGLLQLILGQQWAEMVSQKYLGRWLGYPANVNVVAGASAGQAYRLSSTLLHPNILGGALALTLPFFISLFWLYRRWWARLLLILGMVLNLLCVVFSGSRAAWVAVGVIALLYGIFGYLDRRLVLSIAVVIIVVSLVLVMINPPQFIEMRLTSSSATEAVELRMDQYKAAFDLFLEHPFFGLGMGMEGQRVMVEINNIRTTWAAVENVYLTYLVSYGLVGTGAFLLVILVYWIMLLWARKESRDDPFVRFYSEAFVLGMVGVFVANIFAAWLLFAIPMITLFWFFMGMGARLYNFYHEEHEIS